MKLNLLYIIALVLFACSKPDPAITVTGGSSTPNFYVKYDLAGKHYELYAGKDSISLVPTSEYSTAGSINTYQYIGSFQKSPCKYCEPTTIFGFYDHKPTSIGKPSRIDSTIRIKEMVYAASNAVDRYGKVYISRIINDTVWTCQVGEQPLGLPAFKIISTSDYTDPTTKVKYTRIKATFRCCLYNVYHPSRKILMDNGEADFLVGYPK